MAEHPPNPEEFLLELETHEARQNPNIRFVHRATLSRGPRSLKVAKITEIYNSGTGELHHRELRVESYALMKGLWSVSEKRSVGLTDRGPDEVTPLKILIDTAIQDALPTQGGEFRIVGRDEHEQLTQITTKLLALGTLSKVDLVRAVAEGLLSAPDTTAVLSSMISTPGAGVLLDFAATVKLAEYSTALAELRRLVQEASTTEGDYQTFLAQHPWMFGTEYSELLERRSWVRDEQADFMLRRTADGYVEILEIKRPGMKLFNYDASHDSRYPTADLSKVLGQVMKYLDSLDRSRDSVIAKDKQDPLKIRARIVAGSDTDEGDREALRNLNSHLHRVEVLTYDQLVRIAERVLSIFRSPQADAGNPFGDDEEIPF